MLEWLLVSNTFLWGFTSIFDRDNMPIYTHNYRNDVINYLLTCSGSTCCRPTKSQVTNVNGLCLERGSGSGWHPRGGTPVNIPHYYYWWPLYKAKGRERALGGYLPDSMLSWLVELLAYEGAELILLAVGEGGGGRPAWNKKCMLITQPCTPHRAVKV